MVWLIELVRLAAELLGVLVVILAAVARTRGRGSVLGGVLRRSVGRSRKPRRYESSWSSPNRRQLPVLSQVLWAMWFPLLRSGRDSDLKKEEDEDNGGSRNHGT